MIKIKPKNQKIIVAAVFLLILFGSLIIVTMQKQVTNSRKAEAGTVATIFVHGWASGKAAEYPLAQAAVAQKKAQLALTVTVTKRGKIKISGTLRQKKHPLIFLIFKNNQAGEKQDIVWLHQVMLLLRKKYNLKNYNAVGHSMGAYVLVAYNALYGNQPKLPKLHKLVLIAGPFNGILDLNKSTQPQTGKLASLWDDHYHENSLNKSGAPKIIHVEYRFLLKHRSKFPRQAEVLNIYGNLENGTDSDGTVSTVSVRSLRYLLKSQVASYQETEVTGKAAQHSRLPRSNQQVSRKVRHFLWK